MEIVRNELPLCADDGDDGRDRGGAAASGVQVRDARLQRVPVGFDECDASGRGFGAQGRVALGTSRQERRSGNWP